MRTGSVEQEGAPRAVYERPATRYVADFLGRANVIPARLVGRDGTRLRLAIDGASGVVVEAPDCGGVAEDTALCVAVRPENIAFADPGQPNRVRGTVTEAAYAGDVSRYAVDVGGLILRVTRPNRAGETAPRPARGDAVELCWPEAAGVVLTR
jgi:ABC-type Fe3+/spermidine/putrescine transport system ATPase subunit